MSLRRKILIIFLPFNICLLLASLVYGAYTGYYMELGRTAFDCYFFKHTGFLCPGCGGSRSLVYLLRFDFLKSLKFYPPLIPTLLIILYLDFSALLSFIKNDKTPLRKFKPNILIFIPVLIILNFFVRNVLLFFGIDLMAL